MLIVSQDNQQQIDFSIPSNFKKIAVNVSGGADSAILLYMVIKHLQETGNTDTEVNALTCNGARKGRRNVQFAAEVINTVLDLTEFENFNTHYTYYRSDQDAEFFHEFEQQLFNEHRIDLICSGITANPYSADTTVVDAAGNSIDLTTDALSQRNGTRHRSWAILKDRAFYMPFANIDKRMVADIYRYFDLMESLFPKTRSCEALPGHKWYTETGRKSACGMCWWCLERKWGFGKL